MKYPWNFYPVVPGPMPGLKNLGPFIAVYAVAGHYLSGPHGAKKNRAQEGAESSVRE
jgi:hypothetical protein